MWGCVFFTQPCIIFAQTNLVINGGFEEFTDVGPGCSAGELRLEYYPGWHNEDLSPDPFRTDCWNPSPAFSPTVANTWYFLPYPAGYQYPNTGKAFGGVYLGSDAKLQGIIWNNLRECIQGELVSPLKKGQGYCIEFYVNTANVSNYAVSRLSVYFHVSDTPYRKNIQSLLWDYNFNELEPQVNIQTGPLTDTLGWTKIEAEYIAEGGEKFFIIGNFQDDNENPFTKFQNIYDDSLYGKICYLFFDDVAVYECDEVAVPDDEIIPPNIITPNGDGINDVFDIYGIRPGTGLVVYNRWGAVVFNAESYSNNWKGETKTMGQSTTVNDGVYFYVLTLPSGNKKTGTVTVVK